MLQTILATYKKNRRTQLRAYPISFMFQRVLGSLMGLLLPVLLYYFVFNQNLSSSFLSQTNHMSYIMYVGLGYCSYGLSIATLMNVGRAIILEIREGTLDNFLLSPASRLGYFIGVYLEQWGRAFIEFIIIFSFSIILGMPFSIANLVRILFALLILSVVSLCMAVLLSTVMVFTRDTFITQNTLFIIITVVAGVAFPVSYLPSVVQIISYLMPLTPAITIVRLLISYQSIPLMLWLIMIVESIIYFYIGYFWFRRVEKKLIEEVLS
ncbi:ABC transporter [Lactococcus lactis subsp. lactis NCDO 2118]|jgi:ABC-2 type transport system permease protein|uniref:Transport permease protein n=1 Tax=Lactococcus lactis subsp. lactis NCDO 2118 TaxID=1117941 RepID=A0ABC8A2W9_LACLL|nr:ABC transporter permease [Lactococcus lactis]ABX75561.1 ABC transporter, permease protein [Lactococcus lactis subsp. lactis KF147]AII11593.1 ABC transporter [Lactococcus lactis subsp. lactis NCDO 2118]